jgi:hypothetical protein
MQNLAFFFPWRREARARSQTNEVRHMTIDAEFGVFLPVAPRSARARSQTNKVRHMTIDAEFGVFLPVAPRSARERVRKQMKFAT